MPYSRMSPLERIYAYGSSTSTMSEQQFVYCIECLRMLHTSGTIALGQPVSGQPTYYPTGTNDLYGSQRPLLAHYVVNGTWYCAAHALPAYEAAPTHVIPEAWP